MPLRACGTTPQEGSHLWGYEWLDHRRGPPACFAASSGGGLNEGYGHDGTGVHLGQTETVGETEAEGVLTQNGYGDAPLRCTPPLLSCSETDPGGEKRRYELPDE